MRLQGLGNAMEVKLVGVALAVHLGHNVLVIVHVGFALTLPPASSHLVGVGHFELSVGALPSDAV